ncbi:MAG: hypothetical protein HZB18_05385 [Chloroflexi bacterium]|nr:hypothetical protein [Chloroflexota bacterium]
MSKRKRHIAKPTAPSQIEWFKHRADYPSPEERKAIIQLRRELSTELLMMMLTKVGPESPRAQALSKKYGQEEVRRALETMENAMEIPSFVGDNARSYRDYRQRYARFGEGLKFCTPTEIDDLYMEYAKQLKEGGENKAEKLLIAGWHDWEDITLPAIPPRPADFSAPAPASYPAPVNELLEWGDDLKRSHQFADEAESKQWRKYIPALTRMALDPGLLDGWPSESASWAPWHAIHMLGILQAWESAPALASLADLENDWLSDHLPHIWADMGVEVEPSLWMILEDASTSSKRRGLAAQSLKMMTEENEPIEAKVIAGFEKILKNEKSFDPTLNAYLLNYLRDMEAIDELRETAESAIKQGRVDEEIFTFEDLDEDFDDDYDEDDLDDDSDFGEWGDKDEDD